MPLDMGARMSRRRLLLASAGVVGAALVGRVAPGLDTVFSGTVLGADRDPADGAGRLDPVAGAAPGGGDGDPRLCLGAALFEATQHGDETLVLPAVDRWRELTGFYPAILPLWSPFDLDLPAPRGDDLPGRLAAAGAARARRGAGRLRPLGGRGALADARLRGHPAGRRVTRRSRPGGSLRRPTAIGSSCAGTRR